MGEGGSEEEEEEGRRKWGEDTKCTREQPASPSAGPGRRRSRGSPARATSSPRVGQRRRHGWRRGLEEKKVPAPETCCSVPATSPGCFRRSCCPVPSPAHLRVAVSPRLGRQAPSPPHKAPFRAEREGKHSLGARAATEALGQARLRAPLPGVATPLSLPGSGKMLLFMFTHGHAAAEKSSEDKQPKVTGKLGSRGNVNVY